MEIFIGSSTEAIPKANTIGTIITEVGHNVKMWYDSFTIGEYALESLLDNVNKYDAGVFLFTSDDTLTSRGKENKVARDNVLLEAGIFCGALGRKKVCMCTLPDVYVPSDFKGCTYANLANEHYKLKETINNWLSTILIDADNKVELPGGRSISFSIGGYIENMKKFSDALFLIPINNRFDLNDHVPKSIHGNFINFLNENGISINDIQLVLDEKLGITQDNGNRKTHPLGTVCESYFDYNGKENQVLFFGNSEKDQQSRRRDGGVFKNTANCTPYDFWKQLTNSKITTSKECLLLPLVGTGNAGPLTGSQSIMSSINGYFSFFNSSPIKSIKFSIPKDKYVNEKMDMRLFKECISILKNVYALYLPRSASIPRIARFINAIFHVVGLESCPYTEISLILP